MTRPAAALAFLFSLLPRPAGAGEAGLEKTLCGDVKKPFFSVDCAYDGACRARPQRAGSGAAAFGVPKPAGVKRVFLVGESVAQLLGTPGAGSGAEIVNCGMGGYESSRLKDVFSEVLRYEPDLVVVLSGNNEGPEYPCPGLGPDLRRRRLRLLERFYSLTSSELPPAVRASLKTHEERLEAMAAMAAEKKVPLVFCTLPANLELPPPGPLPLENELFARGLYLFEKKDFKAAAAAFSERLAAAGTDLHARFYLARALGALGRPAEAREQYLKVVELDPAQGRASGARNAMIRRLAARSGAGLCDLEKIFSALSPGGLTGFGLFSDGAHWRQAYGPPVWREIAAAAAAKGISLKAPAAAGAPGGKIPDEELRKTFSYAVSGIDAAGAHGADGNTLAAGVLSEPALAELAFLDRERPGLLKGLARSEADFFEFFISNAWSAGTAGRLPGLRWDFMAHLAELERRKGNYREALGLTESAIEELPDRIFYRLIKAQALHGLGLEKEAAAEFGLLYGAPALRAKALAAARARGLDVPPWAVSDKAAGEERKASKKLSDEGVALARSGDAAGAAALLEKAVAAYPGNAEARFSLCSLAFSRKDYKAALAACGLVRPAAASYPAGLRAGITADALYLEGRILAEVKNPLAARHLQTALELAPAGWPRRAEAQAMLGTIRR